MADGTVWLQIRNKTMRAQAEKELEMDEQVYGPTCLVRGLACV
jgi:hypothetical protein